MAVFWGPDFDEPDFDEPDFDELRETDPEVAALGSAPGPTGAEASAPAPAPTTMTGGSPR
jgi:hypothetical protein